MRIGKNPAKENSTIVAHNYHRVIVPVYIPNLDEAYFKESFDILKVTLQSLLLTVHEKTSISIYNNGSCQIVSDYLKNLFSAEEKVDQLLENKQNIGKINAIYAVVKSSIEPLFTITDADVFFKKDWQQEVEKVFEAFPKAGIVSPVPFSTLYDSNFSDLNFWEGIAKRKLKVAEVPNPEGLVHFEKSIDRKMFKEAHYKQFITLKKNNVSAVLGCGHFVCTLRKEVFTESPNVPTHFKMGGKVMADYIDKPNNTKGYLRLATLKNLAYHIGNRMEPMIQEELEILKKQTSVPQINTALQFEVAPYSWFARKVGKLIRWFVARTAIGKSVFLKHLGLPTKGY